MKQSLKYVLAMLALGFFLALVTNMLIGITVRKRIVSEEKSSVQVPSTCKDGDVLTVSHTSGRDIEEQIIYSQVEYVCRSDGWVKR